ncbi:uncharacterized protein HMPREF1541_02668 [Cyphellophora europaea CBS 101466]|uniref:Mediator complex subunit 27 n=1 Tax=Cyphellophora europaea (strain CBS 101466) TaxID=1220924 RepID=W2S6F7_CYPE1|nr:uncharacterized protein HMPREF1541_02668 [Cyphellophora europaea CBS 101466]ETN43509.1 hypothetical protein HMPREF1541_02668 [Cyphellophora europaea CBS 101466]
MSQLQSVLPDDVHPTDIEIYEQLARLQSMYNQASELRTLLPERLIEPTRFARQAPPEKVAVQLRGAATSGSVQIKNFKRAYQSEEMRSLWQTVNNAEYPQGDDVWTMDYAQSLSKIKSLNGADKAGDSTNADQSLSDHHSVSAIIAKFRESHPTIPINTPAAPDDLPVELTVASMAFQIVDQGLEGNHVYSVAATEDTKPTATQLAVLRHIERSHEQENLQALMGLLASYSNIMSTPCQKCQKVFDQSLKLPIVREKKNSTTSGGDLEWSILHDSCAYASD